MASDAAPEEVTATTTRPVRRTVYTQRWRDVTFLHWPVEPERVAPLLPAGVRPDTLDGVTWVGLVPFRMERIGLYGTPGLPYLGSFAETNVRLYSVDAAGRRGVVFLSLDASRLATVVVARTVPRLPYLWARMRAVPGPGGTWRYTSSRRWPGPRGAGCRVAVRVGAPLEEPGPLEHFLTARWGLHSSVRGRTAYWPNEHPAWPLHTAELLELEEDLVAAAGLPGVTGVPPASVLYSPGVRARFGPRRPVRP